MGIGVGDTDTYPSYSSELWSGFPMTSIHSNPALRGGQGRGCLFRG